jgi:hypothetical protein
MIIFTGGFPYAGKTLLLDLLAKVDKDSDPDSEAKISDSWVRICPKDYYPDDFETMQDSDKSTWAIASWETCLEEVNDAIHKYDNNKLIILDTAAAKVKRMRPLFSTAKIKGHTVIYVFVHSDLADRKERTEEDIDRYEKHYAEAFQVTIPHLKMLSDKFMLIKNSNDPEHVVLNKSAKSLSKMIEEIRS